MVIFFRKKYSSHGSCSHSSSSPDQRLHIQIDLFIFTCSSETPLLSFFLTHELVTSWRPYCTSWLSITVQCLIALTSSFRLWELLPVAALLFMFSMQLRSCFPNSPGLNVLICDASFLSSLLIRAAWKMQLDGGPSPADTRLAYLGSTHGFSASAPRGSPCSDEAGPDRRLYLSFSSTPSPPPLLLRLRLRLQLEPRGSAPRFLLK